MAKFKIGDIVEIDMSLQMNVNNAIGIKPYTPYKIIDEPEPGFYTLNIDPLPNHVPGDHWSPVWFKLYSGKLTDLEKIVYGI